MNIQRMHSEVKLRYNKLNSNNKPDLPKQFIDDYLNNAQDEFIRICYAGNNTKKFKIGFEVTQQRIDLLSSIVIPEETVSSVSLFKPNVYKIELNDLTHPYRHLIRLYANTSCGKIECIPVKHEDIDPYLRNENTKPSAIWRRCLYVVASDGSNNPCLYLYTGGEFTITSVTLSYIKEPKKVFFGGYNTLEFINGDATAPSTVTPAINTELPQTSHDFIVDIAVQLISRSLEDINQLQITEDKITRTI